MGQLNPIQPSLIQTLFKLLFEYYKVILTHYPFRFMIKILNMVQEGKCIILDWELVHVLIHLMQEKVSKHVIFNNSKTNYRLGVISKIIKLDWMIGAELKRNTKGSHSLILIQDTNG